MKKPTARAEPRALDRILTTPDLARLVPELSPEELHRVIETHGLERCTEVVALATSDQLVQLLDLDLWRAGRPGGDEVFNADRFGEWLEVLADTDPAVAGAILTRIDVDLAVAGLVQHIRAFDRAAVSAFVTTDGDFVAPYERHDRLVADAGGFVIVAKRTEAWDAIAAVLQSLAAEQPAYFGRVMRGVCDLSDAGHEVDGLDALLQEDEQAMFDERIGRDQRRETLGYVAAGDARAFLEISRRAGIQNLGALDLSPSQLLRRTRHSLGGGGQVRGHARQPHLTWLNIQMQFLADRAPDIDAARTSELAYLANTLVAGCSVQGRAFSPQEAWEAATATCNLALETLGPVDGFLVDHDLIGVFQTGWTMLHDDVVMLASDALVEVLADLRCHDRLIQADLDALRRELTRQLRTGTPWLARPLMDVLASLDMAAWVALLGLIDQCPVQHGVIAASRDRSTHTVSASAFEFISRRSMILDVQAFVRSLPAALA